MQRRGKRAAGAFHLPLRAPAAYGEAMRTVRQPPFARLAATACAALAALCAGCASLADRAPVGPAGAQAFSQRCTDWDEWDKPAPPFRIHGETWYVGTCGIASILVAGDGAHALLDSGTTQGALLVAANLPVTGHEPGDVGALLVSHEHHDHVGGMAFLQSLTGAPVIAGKEAVPVIRSGELDIRDPQKASLEGMAPVTGEVRAIADGETIAVGGRRFTAIATPGHTRGALSWQWQECAGADCVSIVYADSLSPVSAEGYRFSDHPELLAAYRAGLDKLRALDCDILLTPHPSASKMIERIGGGSLRGGMTCAAYADSIEARLEARLAEEAK